MSALVSVSLNLAKVPKDKVIDGKKGKYLNVTVSINDETDQYGNNAAIYVSQDKEEREAKADRTYLGNGRVVWTDGEVHKYQEEGEPQMAMSGNPDDIDDDLPF